MENSLNFSDEIKETTGLINSAGAWGANEFLVFMVIFGFIVFVVIFWLLNKTANKNAEILVDISVRSNEAIKAAAVEIDDTPAKQTERIKKIYVKDKSCEAELAAYKELFRD